ncbi:MULTISPECIES: hypothetical protein [unclassified Synechocystis]|uniref:hypothetical protein n=1 Tax=unclassified Synechocystis TaxID=2640012 RepID=UPI00048D9A5E|nr:MULTISPECIES: hypothetical protein [unclassified Synechocystis]MCT0255111.1 hypothetical protein [Synechocystis sp. CS-94]
MKTANFITSSCRYCRYYQAEGRRGGICNQLNVPVQGQWKACALAARPFAGSWENLEDVVHLEHAYALTAKDNPVPQSVESLSTLEAA